MKTITINVSEGVYRDFQEYARKVDRKASELIREAMELYWQQRIRDRPSLRDLPAVSVGRVRQPLALDDDLLREMLDA